MNRPNEQPQPNYVLKANEGVLVPKNERLRKIRKAYWVILLVIIVGSFAFQDNLFSELGFPALALLVFIGITLLVNGGNKMVPSPFEIQFYDDYLVVYRERKCYYENVCRKEYDKFYYNDITKCQYRTISKQINIYGRNEYIRYRYNKDGSLNEKPTHHRITEDGLCWFYTTFEPDIDFVAEIEKHSPIKVVVEDH